MKDFLRFGGAQIPCSKSIEKNVETISKAIDWAYENSVDYLITPEGALSGYVIDFDKDLNLLTSSLKKIEEYAKEKRIGLFLGTIWIEKEKENSVKRNQIRYYNKDGLLSGLTNKIIITGHDQDIGVVEGNSLNYMIIKEEDHTIPACGFICNDIYGREGFPNLPKIAYREGIKLFIHSTNAERGENSVHDSVMDDWHNANLRMVSYLASVPVISVDNSILMDGTEWDGTTSSPSGVIINGEWKVQAPRFGTQYFYYDLPLDILVDSSQG